jgi:hypothetical protein
MTSLAKFLYKIASNIDETPVISKISKIAIGSSLIIGLSLYLVFSKPKTKPGHDLGSSEKPQALRNETLRTIESEKRLLEEHRRKENQSQQEMK